MIARVSKDELPAHQKSLTRYALRHPVRLSLGSGVAAAAWGAGIVGDWRASAGGGIAVAIIAGILWSPQGPARRRENRFYNEDGNRRSDA